jgi:hypothetical protein
LSQLPPAVLWIDPGGMTGLAMYQKGGLPAFWANEYGFMDASGLIMAACTEYRDRLWVGWEAFHINAKTHTKSADAHSAIEMIGVARFAAVANRCRVLSPANPGDRNVATQVMLNALGWWRPGKDDAQSAAQHMLAYMLRTSAVPADESRVLRGLR